MSIPRRPFTARLRASLFLFAMAATFDVEVEATHAQDATSPGIVVRGEEIPSAYGAPPAFSRTRFSPSVTTYVLPPGAFLAATIWEGDWLRNGVSTDHLLTQEIEIGLPHRFGLAAEFAAEVFEGRSQIKNVSLEARYALADWNKIPLNPTLFVEYKIGTGRILHDEAIRPPEDEEDMPSIELRRKMTSRISRAQEDDEEEDEEEEGSMKVPDAIEGRLLLGQNFGEKIEWALNAFFEQEIGGDRGREWGFAQAIDFAVTPDEAFKIGVEMEYKNFSDKGSRDDPENRFVIGPSFSWKPNRWSRFDVAPLFGVNDESPRAQVFVVFSMAFGGTHTHEAEAPVSTRNR